MNNEVNKNLKVLLAGTRRQYIIRKLEENNIPFIYFEMATLHYSISFIMFRSLPCNIRIEGGPQAILECAITKTPIVSTNVGVAPEILHEIYI